MKNVFEKIIIIVVIIFLILFLYQEKYYSSTLTAFLFMFLICEKGRIKSVSLKNKEITFFSPNSLKEFLSLSSKWIDNNLNVKSLRQEDIPLYKNICLRDLTLTSCEDEESFITVNTLQKYEEAINDNFYAKTGYDIVTEEWYNALLTFFNLFKVASFEYKHSNQEFAKIIKEMPVSVLDGTVLSSLEEEGFPEKGLLKDFFINKKIKKSFKDSSYLVEIFYENSKTPATYIIEEVFRADFSKNGKEEVFLMVYFHVAGGSLRFFYPKIIQRHENTWIDITDSLLKERDAVA